MAVLDFSKAVDEVPYHRLAAKLDYYGIHGHTKEWICSFLADRHQQVVKYCSMGVHQLMNKSCQVFPKAVLLGQCFS